MLSTWHCCIFLLLHFFNVSLPFDIRLSAKILIQLQTQFIIDKIMSVEILSDVSKTNVISVSINVFNFNRIISATVVMLVIVTLIAIREDIILFIPLLPTPSFFALPSEGTTCECSNESWPDNDVMAANLNLPLPWLNNSSTLQELKSRHPNLPIELLYDAKHRRCSLLPTLFR